MLQGFIDGIKSMFGKIGETVSKVAEKVSNFLHFSRPDEGPLRDYETWMPDMIDGLSKTLEKSSSRLYKTTRVLAQKMAEELNFGDSETNVTGNVIWKNSSIDTQPLAYQISNRVSGTYKNEESQNRQKSINLENLVQKLVDILLAYFPQFVEIMKQPIVTEDGTIIAYYTPKINEELRRIRDKEERGS